MTRVVFHVGAHKTGTTLVQDYLGQQLKSLRDKGIAHVPRGRMSRLVGWGDVLADDPAPFASEIAALAADPSVHTVVLSHEDTLGHPFTRADPGIYPDAAQNAQLLRGILDGYDVDVVLSARRQHEFLASYYLQTVHEGGTETFAEWAAHLDLDQLSWQRVIRPFAAAFGADAVRPLDFAAIRVGQSEYLRRFMNILDPALPVDERYRPRRSNRSVSGKGLQLALAANPHLHGATERRELTDFLQRYFSNADYPAAEPVPPDLERRLRERYDAEYEELFR